MVVTLILTHQPYDEYIYDHGTGQVTDHVQGSTAEQITAAFAPNRGRARPRIYSGLWGTMGVFIGPKVHTALWPGDEHLGERVPEAGFDGRRHGFADGQLKMRVDMAAQQKHAIARIWLANRIIELETDEGATALETTYTTAERFRGSAGRLGADGFVMLPQRPEPYDLHVQGPYQELIRMRPSHDGEYVRIRGQGLTSQQEAILIHEAANPGWVTGCIAPRPLGDHSAFQDATNARNPSAVATMELLRTLKTKGAGKGQLFVVP